MTDSENRVTVLVGAGQSQALGLPGTKEITDAADAALGAIGGDEYVDLRYALPARLGPLVNFEHIAFALEMHMLLDEGGRAFRSNDGTVSYSGYDTIAPAVIARRHQIAPTKSQDLYDILLRTVAKEVSGWAADSTDVFSRAAAFYGALSGARAIRHRYAELRRRS